MGDCIVPAGDFSLELKIANSRFIASIGPAISVAEAKAFIAAQVLLYSDATHNVPAYIIGHGKSIISHCSDDGEPRGTAGRPALAVLSGSGLGDLVLVVTRYFGGTKLGTGGLVKAYGDCAREALAGVRKAKKTSFHRAHIETPYNLYEQILRLIKTFGGIIENEAFAENVSIEFSAPARIFDRLEKALSEISQGKIKPALQLENFTIKIPL